MSWLASHQQKWSPCSSVECGRLLAAVLMASLKGAWQSPGEGKSTVWRVCGERCVHKYSFSEPSRSRHDGPRGKSPVSEAVKTMIEEQASF